jgi:hypothetical protein
MNFKRTATIVIGGAAFLAWLAGAATPRRAIPPPIVTPPQAIDARGLELTNEVARLRDRLRPTAVPSQPRRNLFTFRESTGPSRAAPSVPLVQPAAIESAVAHPADVPLKLAGIAEDSGPDGPDRTAIISGQGQLFMVKEGEQVTARYLVAKIAADAVELTDVEAGTTRRLVMK